MATRTRKNSAAIAESIDTAPAAIDAAAVDTVDTVDPAASVGIPTLTPAEPTDTPTDTPDPDTAPAESDPAESDTPPTLSYVVDGVTHTVDASDIESLADAIGLSRNARHGRTLAVGQFIATHPGMNANRTHTLLNRAGHFGVRDTVYGAANAYALAAEFTPVDTLQNVGSILAETLSLVDAVGIRKIRGTHSNVSVIDYDRLAVMTDPASRESEFAAAIRAALETARANLEPAPPVDTPPTPDPVDPDPVDPDPVDPDPVDPADTAPAIWARTLADIAGAIRTAPAMTGPERAALADSASAILAALADTADSIDRPEPVDTAGQQTLTPAPAIDPAADRLAAAIDADRAAAAAAAAVDA